MISSLFLTLTLFHNFISGIESALLNDIPSVYIVGAGIFARQATRIANQRAINAGDFHDDGSPNTWGNIHDARRHFSWMHNTARISDKHTARFFGDRAEIFSLRKYNRVISQNGNVFEAYFDRNRLKDLWNNSVGYSLGSTNRNRFFMQQSPFDYALSRGLIIENVSDVERMFGIQMENIYYIRALWDIEQNILTFLDEYGNPIRIVDLYVDPLSGGVNCSLTNGQ